MIAKLRGTIDTLKPTELILDVAGVGYALSIPLSTYEQIKDLPEAVLHVYTLHKEDQFRLFGFYTEREKEFFALLLQVSGIGPAMAISLLSGSSIELIVEAVRTENTGILTRIPGIGKAKAEKLVFELKRKIKSLPDEVLTAGGGSFPSSRHEAILALGSLGFDENQAAKTVDSVLQEKPESTLEELIKRALHILSL